MYEKEVTIEEFGAEKVIRIPDEILKMLSVKAGDLLTMRVDSGKLVVEPVKPEMTIHDFLKDGKAVVEGEFWTDGPVGREVI